jgi:hypothetical protein
MSKIALSLVVLLLAGDVANSAVEVRDVSVVSLVSLIATPERFDGIYVNVQGIAYFKTAFIPNSTAFQVGGFLYDAVNNHDGTVTYTVRNQASAYSLFLHIPGLPHKPRGGNLHLFGNIDQTFT